MSSSIGPRREAKAARRKKQLAERRRKGETASGGSLATLIKRSALAPLHCCLLQDGLFDRGMGTMLLARGTPATGLIMASFLLDVFCLGVKDVMVGPIEAAELDYVVAAMAATGAMAEVEPAHARKLLRELVAYARSLGLEPHREYAAAEKLFGDVSPDASDARFQFGCEGRPVYVLGPGETTAQVRRRLERLRRTLGEEGFDLVVGAEEGLEEDEDEFEGGLTLPGEDDLLEGYDAAAPPDPGEWLKLDEDERTLRIEHYHRRAGLRSENDALHAILHLIVEDQVAGDEPRVVKTTVTRLMAEGLDRHEAIHAIIAALGAMLSEMIHGKEPAPFSASDYAAALDGLSAESWRRLREREGGS